MRPLCLVLPVCCLAALLLGKTACADDAADAKVTLRYRFEPGQTLRWKVTHRNCTRTTVSGTTRAAETNSVSVKVWRVKRVEPDGTATFVHSVEDVDMWQKLSDRAEVRYDSGEQDKAPQGFQHVAESVGVPLSTVTINPLGEVLDRKQHDAKAAAKAHGPVTIPLPEEPVAVGDRWSKTEEIRVQSDYGAFRKIKARQTFELEDLRTGVATIRVSTQILTPIDDPSIEWQVVQHAKTGEVRFDVEAGRVLSQELEVDERVVGFRGETSSMHYGMRFEEVLLESAAATAARPTDPRR